MEMSKMDPEMDAQTRSFFGHLAPFFSARRPWESKWLPSLPQEPPRPVQASIFINCWLIFDDFLMIFCIMWATFYMVCFIVFLVTSRFGFLPQLGSWAAGQLPSEAARHLDSRSAMPGSEAAGQLRV